ncbi:MSHA biogenesis protein MshD [Hahella sp. CCB-MM4]|uniref:type IV pilus modification PilV family protein n=1 Tax=Hahella sp. (strain CCB-MM4) TaxID=1926491 RepID=UPI000B9BF011|nr:type II secretion system protein [Hahella sp. CCB-MM4]OZG70848.1 MSHA biogenesis protein MshD [Hahella sp. CCB-MM4]
MKACAIRKRCRQNGITLIELVISIVVLGIALTAIVSAISTSVSRSSNILLQDRMIELSQAYMDEIVGKRFDEDTPIGGYPPVTNCTINTEEGDRGSFDDVDDYDGLDEAPTSQTTANFANYTDYRVTVSVVCAGTDMGLSADKWAKRVQVAITAPNGQVMVFTAYKGNY